MTLMTPAHDFGRGIRSYLRGIAWLRAHPRYLALLFVPMAIGLIFMVGGITLFSAYDQKILSLVLFQKPDAWYLLIAYYFCQVLLYLAVLVLAALAALLLMNVVASPFYEAVSTAVERDLTGQGPPKLTIGQHLRVMLVELKKVALILFITTLVLFIPGLNVISTLFAAFLVGWDFFDYPLARRGWSLRKRIRLVSGNFFAVLGLGLWLVIPFAQIVMLPLAVAGGTLLNLEALERLKLSTPDPYLKEV